MLINSFSVAGKETSTDEINCSVCMISILLGYVALVYVHLVIIVVHGGVTAL